MQKQVLPFFLTLWQSRLKIAAVLFLLLTLTRVQAQHWHEPADTLNRKRLVLVSAAQGALYASSLAGLYGLWYSQYDSEAFHLFNDWDGWLQMDKAGHAATAYQSGLQLYRMNRWTGLGRQRSLQRAWMMSYSYQLAVEVMDGFSSGWGFSPGDLAANTVGTATLLTQEWLWQEQRVYWKFSFLPSGLGDRPGEEGRRARDLFGTGLHEQWLKDYNGQTYWLSMNIWSLCGKPASFPRWVNLAVGYSADNLLGAESNSWYDPSGTPVHSTLQLKRQWLLSLDIDLYRARLPFPLTLLRPVFGIVKLPFPALEWNSADKWRGHWLYF